MGFTEVVVIGIVLLIVVGPRELPKLLRTVGQMVRKLRGLSVDLRQQSGIDEIIREEGLREDLDAIRSLSRGRVVDSLVREAMKPQPRKPVSRQAQLIPTEELTVPEGTAPTPEDERPMVGPDAYGALADDAPVPEKPAQPHASGPKGPEAPAELPAPNEINPAAQLTDESKEGEAEAVKVESGATRAAEEPR
jgi:sec-independent protein translocase protein TatB